MFSAASGIILTDKGAARAVVGLRSAAARIRRM